MQLHKNTNIKHPWYIYMLFLVLYASPAFTDEIYVGGSLAQDEVWTRNNIYIVTQDLKILRDVTLTIEPGVQVKVNQNRGIFIYGSLIANGQIDDSISFSANHVSRWLQWKWKGLIYIGVKEVQENIISYAVIEDAEVAVDIYISDQIEIENVSIRNNQFLGIRISNSNSINIKNCNIIENYDGIELAAKSSDTTSHIQIDHCIIKNANHNIYINKEANSVWTSNQITNSLIEGANNGIWMDNGGGVSLGTNMIERNVIINNGNGAGYGMFVSLDSVLVKNNIFWNNNIALYYEQSARATNIIHNSFYQNYRGIVLSEGSASNRFINNTLAINKLGSFEIAESTGTLFYNNNLFPDMEQQNMIVNNTSDNIDLEQNFWNTRSEEVIQTLIWDKNDNQDLGQVIFNPILMDADTTDPVSPPFLVKKQLANEEVLISWMQNPESDLSNYYIYYENFENYTFSEQLNAGTDTSILISDISISDTIAVTAVDKDGNVEDAQVLGYESPFAFAQLYPYAGPDVSMCNFQTQYALDESTIPFNYQSLNWTTSGDGYFSSANVLHPIYFPGPIDFQTEEVVLTLSVLHSDAILEDDLTLNINDGPMVYAGNDTIIIADSSIVLSDATAYYYTDVFWETTGDGEFSSETIVKPTYTPGEQDIDAGYVDLIISGSSDCGTAKDTISVFIKSLYAIEGIIWYQDQRVNQAVVMAEYHDNNEIRAVKLVEADNDGYFKFENLLEGDYYLYAVIDTNILMGAIPTYYANKMHWQDAYKLTLEANTFDVDINLKEVDFQLPGGEASISGHFDMPAANLFTSDLYCQSWFDNSSLVEYCENGLSNITILLYNEEMNKVLDYTLTDQHGDFFFSNLAFGKYRIGAEKTGYQTTASSVIELSPEHTNEMGVVIGIDQLKNISITLIDKDAENHSAAVFPNPASDILNIRMNDAGSANTTIEIYNMVGELVLQNKTIIGGHTAAVTVEIQHLPPGLYIGSVRNATGEHRFKFIKH